MEARTNVLSVRVAPDVAYLPDVRQGISTFAHDLEPKAIEDLRLLVNELVTNSLRHARFAAGDQIAISAEILERAVLVEVRDPGPGFRRAVLGDDPRRTQGWGLFLLDRLAERWGVDTKDGCRVWFVLRTDPV